MATDLTAPKACYRSAAALPLPGGTGTTVVDAEIRCLEPLASCCMRYGVPGARRPGLRHHHRPPLTQLVTSGWWMSGWSKPTRSSSSANPAPSDA
jgi:hypothetical protein